MDVIGLIKNALSALTAYLELKNKVFYYDIISKSKQHQKELINEIEVLRNTGTSASNERADILRAELIKERRDLEHLSAHYSLSGRR